MFFSLAGFTEAALEWADETSTAAFEFGFDESISARSAVAHELLADGAARVLTAHSFDTG